MGLLGSNKVDSTAAPTPTPTTSATPSVEPVKEVATYEPTNMTVFGYLKQMHEQIDSAIEKVEKLKKML